MPRLFLMSSPGLADDLRQLFGANGGAYRLLCLNDLFKEALPVPRALADDSSGTLYIGAAKTFVEELVELQKELKALAATNANIQPRGSIGRYFSRFRERYPYDHLCVSVQQSDNPVGCERELLEEYVSKYGEVPPLNEA